MKKVFKFLLVIGAILLFCLVLRGLVSSDEKLRSFDFESEIESVGDDSAGSGRMGYWRDKLGTMSQFQVLVGAGSPSYRIPRDPDIHITNCHSMYVNLFYQSGVVGALLFVIFILFVFCQNNKARDRYYCGVAKMFVGVWLLTGVAESMNIRETGSLQLLMGIAMAISTRK